MQKPRILLLGADGFIGRHIAFYLQEQGYNLLCSARNPSALKQMGFKVFKADLTDPTSGDPNFWRSATDGVEVIINAAGMLKGTDAQMHAVHVDAPTALYAAAKKQTKIILVSATGVEAKTPFGVTKLQGETAVKNSSLPYTILRPSLVLADTSYGGSSLLRALAILPFFTPTVGSGTQAFDPIHANDLARAIEGALQADTMNAQTIFPCGPERVTQLQMLQSLRAWLGHKPNKHIMVPLPLARGMGWLGDRLKLGPISQTAVTQIEQGVSADYDAFHKQSGISAKGFTDIIAARPAGTQDIWHARLYLLRPVVRFALMFMWLLSGLVGLLIPSASFLPDMAALNLSDNILTTIARSAGLMDIGIAVGLLLAWKLPHLALVQLMIVGAYTVIFGVLTPDLWLDPYGGLLKNIPILIFILIHRILEVER